MRGRGRPAHGIAGVAHTHIHALLGILHPGLMAAVIDCVNSLLGEPNAESARPGVALTLRLDRRRSACYECGSHDIDPPGGFAVAAKASSWRSRSGSGRP